MSPRFWCAAAGGAALGVGAVSPWLQVGFVTVTGTDRGSGWALLALAVVAGVMLRLSARDSSRGPLVIAAGTGLAALAIVTSEFFRIDEALPLANVDVDPAWGLYLAGGGSLALLAFAVALILERGPRRRARRLRPWTSSSPTSSG